METKDRKLEVIEDKQNQTVEDKRRAELREKPAEKVVERVPEDELKAGAKDRSKKRPLIQKIVQAITREKRSYKELVINSEPLEKRVALLDDGVLQKFEVEREGEERMVGAIFKGKIQNLEPGLKAAFVDINQPKNAFLHYWDIVPAANNEDSGIEIIRDNKTEAQRKSGSESLSIKDVPKKFPIGTDIVVQITKAQIGTKGPRTTTNIALPGRFLVLMPFSGQCGISRKIESREERNRLKTILKELTIPEGMGVIIRTAGEGKKARYFVRDLHILLKTWESIQAKINELKKPACLYQEPDLIERTVRDFLTEDIDRVLVDNKEDYERILRVVSAISPRSKSKIHFFGEDIPIFERFNVERQIEQTFMRKVPLPSGGEIVIEETEALISVDVNTGGHRSEKKDGKDFILQANLEAASEVARQCKLRNIGGLIIIDFIDMKAKRDRNAVLGRMRDEMARDKAKNHVLPISQLGIMQMTRQRHSESNASHMYTACPYCSGKGIVKSARTMSVEIQRKITSILRHERNGTNPEDKVQLRVYLHPLNLERLRHDDERVLLEIEDTYGCRLAFRADPEFHIENFKIVDVKSGQELR
ncbi:MAG: Rne/Rng family ribonuclease [Opitutales bacterium]|nr:Rne/Rng family ribonuclease [Opitutales bacterium]NRA26665.1 Rne/Rng family ribonuclease [Opitutales bacterium]